MQYRTFAVSAAVLSGALAASSSNPCDSSFNATSQSDLDQLASCQKLTGDLLISGDLGNAIINGVQEITGDLTIINATALASLNAPALESIGGTFDLQVLNQLSTLSFPQLTAVGAINFVTLPSVSELQFNAVVSKAGSVLISDTGITALTGISLNNTGSFNINNNRYLSEVNVGLQSVSDALAVSFNGQKVQATFPDLEWANNITFQDVASVSLPKLTAVNQSAGFINNTINGLNVPNLETIGGSLAIVFNPQLTNVSFPALSTIGGGFQVANNTQLSSILGFPKVKSVGGAIDFIGSFSKAALPSLTLVKGDVDVESDSKNFNCSAWDTLNSNRDIQGDTYVCKAASSSTSVAVSATSTSGSSGTATGASASATGSGSSSSSSKGGAAGSHVIEYTSLFGALAAFVFQLV